MKLLDSRFHWNDNSLVFRQAPLPVFLEIYYFDEKGRLVKFTNALEYSTQYEYDGQNHQTKVTNPRNYPTTFQYDGNHNLTKITNALLKDTINTYDTQFRLTDTIDPLLHGGHVDYDTEHHPTASKYGVLYNTSFLPLDNGLSQTSASYYANGLTQTATDARLTRKREKGDGSIFYNE